MCPGLSAQAFVTSPLTSKNEAPWNVSGWRDRGLEHPFSRDDKERALLSFKVCDPSAGSGHFMLAAARRLGRDLARVRSGEAEPNPADYRRAVRDVIRRCIYT